MKCAARSCFSLHSQISICLSLLLTYLNYVTYWLPRCVSTWAYNSHGIAFMLAIYVIPNIGDMSVFVLEDLKKKFLKI